VPKTSIVDWEESERVVTEMSRQKGKQEEAINQIFVKTMPNGRISNLDY
jgi:hypothetical protein